MEYWKNTCLENITYINNKGVECVEIWKPLPECEKVYEVSNLGRIKSLKREYINKGVVALRKGNIVKGYINKQGYRCVNIVYYKNITVHLLIAIAFHNHKRCGHRAVVDHIDENKLNNCIENLRIVTSRINTMRGYKNTTSKYTGVSLCRRSNRFVSTITIGFKQISLGSYLSEEEAKKIYDLAFDLKEYYLGNNNEFRKLIKSYV